MPNIVKVKLVGPVTLYGHIVEAGEEIELMERSAAALIEEGRAVAIATQTNATPGVGDGIPVSNGEGTPQNPEGAEGQINVQEELDKVKRALDEKYKRDELAAAAKDIGVEFPYDAKKAEIVEAVVAADKATVLLEV